MDLIDGQLEVLLTLKSDMVDQKVLIENLMATIDSFKVTVDFLSGTLDELKKSLHSTQQEVKMLSQVKEDVIHLRNQNRALVNRVNQLEDYSRKDNMIISGIPERQGEDCREICTALFKEVFDMSNVAIVRTHRLGHNTSKNRKIIVRFKFFEDKQRVIKNRMELKNKRPGVFIDDDYSQETLKKRQNLRPVVKLLKTIDQRAHLRGDKIFHNGRLYSQSELHELPLDPHKACTKTQAGVTVFAGTHSRLSNLYPVEFELEGRIWQSVEQYYQFNKALASQKLDIARQIRETSDPVEAMFIGKQVTPGQEWKDRGPEIMKTAMRKKFHIPALKYTLVNSGITIGEGTKNAFWGIGLSIQDNDACNPTAWTGQNIAGQCLMDVRREIVS